jgi:hypothetical protein
VASLKSAPYQHLNIKLLFTSLRHKLLVDRIQFITKSDRHDVHSWLLQAETFEPQWCSSPLCTVACLRITLKHPRLGSSNDIIGTMWVGLTGLDGVFMSCDCPFAYLWYCMEQTSCKSLSFPTLFKEPDEFISWLMCSWSSINLSLFDSRRPPILMSHSESFKPFKDTCTRCYLHKPFEAFCVFLCLSSWVWYKTSYLLPSSWQLRKTHLIFKTAPDELICYP